ncbi:unnamed protein product [Chironomus riparius]|uniref:Uncharacterized protein n=1 Tax=Chironomus riparius TaxID=315576 RepID=A0A9N9RIM8_9DIPT|nr:unnamed protein product [Chironomus riparius]
MSKSNSGKKNPIKKAGRKDFETRYDPLFNTSNKSKEKLASSLTPEQDRRKTIHSEIPNILKRNIAALSESTESIKLTDFGKSFTAVDDKSPPKKKSKSLFDKLQYDDSQNIEIAPSGFENKRLKHLRDELKPQVMFSSPSILNEKPSIPRSPEQKFPTTAYNVNSSAVDEFDKLKLLENQVNVSKDNSNEERTINDNGKDENTSKDKKKKNLGEEKSVTDTSSSSSHSAIINNSTKIDENIIKNYRNSFKGFRRMLSSIKSINDKIVAFRQELSEGIICDFPSSI